ncbi:hypothetical protein AB3M81_18425, partial [Aeromicrobium sp. 179-A 4D2 NHS]
MKTTPLALAVAGGVLLAGLPAMASADDDGPRRDVNRTGNHTVKKGTEINGNVTVRNGRLVINGDVDGNVTLRNGSVVVRGDVDGNVRQFGRGSVVIAASGSVDGNVAEKGRGNVDVRGDVDGNVTELDHGHLRVLASAEI